MSWNSFSDYLNEKIIDGGTSSGLCVVLGSGIHKLLSEPHSGKLYEAVEMLSSWEGLLSHISTNYRPGVFAPLEWERLLIESEQRIDKMDFAAHDMENYKLNNLSKTIESAESLILSDKQNQEKYTPLIKILNSKFVTDVISLNFDLLSEKLFLNDGVNKVVRPLSKSVNKLNHHRILKNTAGNVVRFWHPHGDYTYPKQMVLGSWRYGQLLVSMNQARLEMKKNDKEDYENFKIRVQNNPQNWLEIMLYKPLLFIGTSIDLSDLTMWNALILRQRNFFKFDNRQKMSPAWRLCIHGEGNHIPDSWVEKLEGRNYTEAWSYLVNGFGA